MHAAMLTLQVSKNNFIFAAIQQRKKILGQLNWNSFEIGDVNLINHILKSLKQFIHKISKTNEEVNSVFVLAICVSNIYWLTYSLFCIHIFLNFPNVVPLHGLGFTSVMLIISELRCSVINFTTHRKKQEDNWRWTHKITCPKVCF